MSPPRFDELEVSVFGPGRGESVIIHIGNQKWITIDSCKTHRDQASPALSYLEQLGVNIAQDIVLVVATHAHDDHTAGLSQIYEAAKSARFVTSAAFTSNEFFATVAADEDIEAQLNLSVRREFRAVLEEARRRGGRGERPIVRATEQKVILDLAEAWEGGPPLRIVSLSPSETAIDRAHQAVAAGAASLGERRRLSAPDPNEYSVAIWVEIGEKAMLFGGDLLIGPAGCGWIAVSESHTVSHPASIFKVPHHGSINAHLPQTWSDLVAEEAVALITPFRMGARSIPKDSDVARISALASRTFITAKAQQPASPRDVKRAKAALPTFALNVREVGGLAGHVQARLSANDAKWEIGVDAPAFQAG